MSAGTPAPSALTLFVDAPGWGPMPSAARVLAHALAHPRPWGFDDGGDCDRNEPAGLWMARAVGGTGPVILSARAGEASPPVNCMVASPLHPCGFSEPMDPGDGATFLPLAADGRPLPAEPR